MPDQAKEKGSPKARPLCVLFRNARSPAPPRTTTLNGTTKDDVICGKAGGDTINGEEGNDVIRGGQGDDGGGQPLCIDGGGGAPIVRGLLCDSDRTIVRAPIIFGLNGNDGGHHQGPAGRRLDRGQRSERQDVRGSGDDCPGEDCTFSNETNSEPGNDFLKTKDKVSGNDFANGGDNTDTCRIDVGD
jgi:hypothetical protein